MIKEAGTEVPRIFQFVFESDLVAVATVSDLSSVAKARRGDQLDLAEAVAGFVYTFQVEDLLYSRESFHEKRDVRMDTTRQFKTFTKVGNLGEMFQKMGRYLLFIREIPKDEKLASEYGVSSDAILFRPYEGSQSIFGRGNGEMHGASRKGIVDLSKPENQSLMRRIEKFCEALSSGNREFARKKLEILVGEPDKELSEAASYTIKFLTEKAGV